MKILLPILLLTTSMPSLCMEDLWLSPEEEKLASASSNYPENTSESLSENTPLHAPVYIKLEPLDTNLNLPLFADLQLPPLPKQPREICSENIVPTAIDLTDCKPKNRFKRKIKKGNSSTSYSRIPRKHTCNQCKKTLSYSWGLIAHIKRIHEKPPRWECPFLESKNCMTTFVSNSDYNKHLKEQHGVLKPLSKRSISARFIEHRKDPSFTIPCPLSATERRVTRTLTGHLRPKVQ